MRALSRIHGLPPATWRVIVPAVCLAALLAGQAAPAAAAGGEQERLLGILNTGGMEARREAMAALARRGNPAAVPAVLPFLRAEDPVLRKLAEDTLWAIWTRSGDTEVDRVVLQGQILMVEDRHAEAVRLFTWVIGERPDFAEGYNKRATALYNLGRYLESLRDIDETLKRNPYHFGALSGAGLCLIELDRLEEALRYFNRALDINPNMSGVIELRSRILERLKKPMT